MLVRLLAARAAAKRRSEAKATATAADGPCEAIFSAAAAASSGGVWSGDQMLYAHSVAPATLKGYAREATRFLDFVKREELPLTCGLDLDIALSLFARFMYDEGYGAATGERIVAAANFVWPLWSGDVRITPICVAGWRKLRPSTKRVPLTRAVTVAIATRLAAWGLPSAAVVTLLAFHCYLRIGEFTTTRCVDVVPAASERVGLGNPHMFIGIPKAKTGPLQDVEVLDHSVEQLTLLAVAAAGGPDSTQRVCALSEYQFRKAFRAACDSWGIPADVTPHSLRHGGATHDYTVVGRPAKEIKVRGRWQRDKSFAHYVGTMRASVALQRHPANTVQTGAILAANPLAAFKVALSSAPANEEVLRFRKALGLF